MPTPRLFSGKLILVPGGIGGEDPCCCGPLGPASEEYEPCGCQGTNCVTDPTADGPSVQLTLFSAVYAGADVTWCNEVWTAAQINVGEFRCVCPTKYSEVTVPGRGGFYWFVDSTVNNTYPSNRGLFLARFYASFFQSNNIRGRMAAYARSSLYPASSNAAWDGSPAINAGLPASPTDADNSLPMMSSHLDVPSGITYTWAQGDNWP